ncbi:MAG TPA: hypothetical protein VKS78_04285 [Roseiarcus sp.]|nr:hypothetical protein [Roseiarcus sp.]
MTGPAAVLFPHMVAGKPDDPSGAVVTWEGTASGILTVQAADDDALRALLDEMLERPDAVRDCLLVCRASLATGN